MLELFNEYADDNQIEFLSGQRSRYKIMYVRRKFILLRFDDEKGYFVEIRTATEEDLQTAIKFIGGEKSEN